MEYGAQAFRLAAACLAYAKSSDRLGPRYGQPARGSGLELFAARSNAGSGETELRGNDTFEPFFVGKKRLVSDSEQVLVDGRRLGRADGPGDGDYAIDYDGGFIYFHAVLLLHETDRVTFE